MEQGTGIEPAFTAWEAVVLPIYEPCIGAIIAEWFAKCKCFLSERVMFGICLKKAKIWVEFALEM